MVFSMHPHAITPDDARLVEGPRALMEVTVYDWQGRKIDHSVYAVSGSQPVGKEVYKHDARGNQRSPIP